MGIFAGVRWRGVSNESGVVENGDFSLLSLAVSSEHSHLRPHVAGSPLVALQ